MKWIDHCAEFNAAREKGEVDSDVPAVEGVNFRSEDGRWVVCLLDGAEQAEAGSRWVVWERVLPQKYVRRLADHPLVYSNEAFAAAEFLARHPARGFVAALRLASAAAAALAGRLGTLASLPQAFDRGLGRWLEARRTERPRPSPTVGGIDSVDPVVRLWADDEAACVGDREGDA